MELDKYIKIIKGPSKKRISVDLHNLTKTFQDEYLKHSSGEGSKAKSKKAPSSSPSSQSSGSQQFGGDEGGEGGGGGGV